MRAADAARAAAAAQAAVRAGASSVDEPAPHVAPPAGPFEPQR